MAEVPASLRTAIAAYSTSVHDLGDDNPDDVLSLLRQRNEIEQLKQACGDRSDAIFGDLVAADKVLKGKKEAIAQCEDLQQWRQTLDIPEQYWWWVFRKLCGSFSRRCDRPLSTSHHYRSSHVEYRNVTGSTNESRSN